MNVLVYQLAPVRDISHYTLSSADGELQLPLEAIGTPYVPASVSLPSVVYRQPNPSSFLSCIIATMASRLMLNIRVVATSQKATSDAVGAGGTSTWAEMPKTPERLEFRVHTPVEEEVDPDVVIGFYAERGVRETDGDDSSSGEWV